MKTHSTAVTTLSQTDTIDPRQIDRLFLSAIAIAAVASLVLALVC